MANIEREIFKAGSTTYYFSSIFFPKKVQQDVFKLYSFVRVADDYVDSQPAQPEELNNLRKLWQEASSDLEYKLEVQAEDSVNIRVVKNIVYLSKKYQFETAWIEAFLDSMQMDVDCRTYQTLAETLEYIYGSAEVIGLMMSRIMRLSKEADEAARLQGRAMQFINFIRDVEEDNKLGRMYFPAEDLAHFNLGNLSSETAGAYPDAFKEFVQLQLQRYIEWQYKAEDGFHYIPRRLRIPLKTAVSMYNWTGQQIKKDPFIVYRKKVKPSKFRILRQAYKNFFTI